MADSDKTVKQEILIGQTPDKERIDNIVSVENVNTGTVDTEKLADKTSAPFRLSAENYINNLPQFIKDAPFVLFKLKVKDGKTDKIPVKIKNPNFDIDKDEPLLPRLTRKDFEGASSTNPKDWLDFDNAVKAFDNILPAYVNGIGVVLNSQSNITCIDLDHCFQPDGSLKTFASDVVKRFDSAYIEISQSGNGLHICFYDEYAADLPRKRSKKFEIYNDKRAILLTGNIFNGHCGAQPVFNGGACNFIKEQFVDVDDIELMPIPDIKDSKPAVPTDELLEIIKKSPLGKKFFKLFNGDLDGFYITKADGDTDDLTKADGTVDWSRADFMLCLYLCFWTNGNYHQIREIWQRSTLAKRDKFTKRMGDYDQLTICSALAIWDKKAYKPPKKHVEQNVVADVEPRIDVPLPDSLTFPIKCPKGFKIDERGMFILIEKRGRHIWQQFSNSIVLIHNTIRNINSKKVQRSLLCRVNNHWFSTSPIDNRELYTNSQITRLAELGVDIRSENAAFMAKWIADFDAVNHQHIPVIETVNTPGWQDNGEFVYPNSDDSLQLAEPLRSESEKIFAVKGKPENVIPILKKLQSNDIAMIAIGNALNAPIVHLVDGDNTALHIYGNTGCGKTTIAKLAFSLFGNPRAKSAMSRADISRAGIESFFVTRNDFLAIVEDIDSINDERTNAVISKLPYQFVDGQGATRANKDGSQRPPLQFRGALQTTGEHQLTSDTSRGGGKRRLLELPVPDNFITLDDARDIGECVKENYGLFGRQWIALLQALNLDDIKAYIKAIRAGGAFGFKGLHVECQGKIPLLIDNIASIAAAIALFNHHILHLGPLDSLLANEYHRAVRILALTPDNTSIADWKRAIPLIKEFIASKDKFFTHEITEHAANPDAEYHIDLDSTFHANELYGCRRKNFTAILPSILENYLTKCGFSAKTIVKQLASNGFFLTDGKNIAGKVKNFQDFKSIRMYKIPNHFLDDSDGENNDCIEQSHIEQSHIEQSHIEQSHIEQSHIEQSHIEEQCSIEEFQTAIAAEDKRKAHQDQLDARCGKFDRKPSKPRKRRTTKTST